MPRPKKKLPAEPIISSTPSETLADILTNGSPLEIRTLFNFDHTFSTFDSLYHTFLAFGTLGHTFSAFGTLFSFLHILPYFLS